jgi:hypothetical protein
VAEPREDRRTPPPAQQTENARRAARYTYAQRRIKKIVDGWPPLTEAQRDQLALLLRPGGGGDAA